MVHNAPTIDEVSDKIIEITKDTIFVAHSVNFDYNVIKHEFKNLGIDFVRKKLCTVRLSRKLIPGYTSYSLGKLCSALDIPLTDRHRARGDAHATVLLFKKLLQAKGAEKVFKSFLNSRSQEATLPPLLSREIYEGLPEVPGIYFFKNTKGVIIYIGKAINIKKRVLSHFYNKSTKEVKMCQETHNKLKAAPNPISLYYSISDCRAALEEVCKTHELCPKYCHLQEDVEHCSHYSITTCLGICKEKEDKNTYNLRVLKGIEALKNQDENFVIQERGRTLEEQAFIWIENGRYAGYGFIQKEETIHSYDDLETFLIRKKNTLETQRILESYLFKNPEKEKFLLTKPIL